MKVQQRQIEELKSKPKRTRKPKESWYKIKKEVWKASFLLW
jgi:hypothetical protein